MADPRTTAPIGQPPNQGSGDSWPTAAKLRLFIKDLQQIADKHDERVSTEDDILGRLTYAFGMDGEIIFSYAVRGHLSHAGYLREKYGKCK